MSDAELEGYKLHWRSVGPCRKADLLDYLKRTDPKMLTRFIKELKVKTVDGFIDALLEKP